MGNAVLPGGGAGRAREAALPVITVESIDEPFADGVRAPLGAILPDFLRTRRWFGAKARPIAAARIGDVVRLIDADSYFVFARVDYESGEPDDYLLPLRIARGERAGAALTERPAAALAWLSAASAEGLLYESIVETGFAWELLNIAARTAPFRGEHGEIAAWTTKDFARDPGVSLEPKLLSGEQSNSSIIYGATYILKLFRRIEAGINPDLEICAYLSQEAGFANVPPVAAAIEYRPARGEPATVAFIQRFIANEGDAWKYTLREVHEFGQRVEGRTPPETAGGWMSLVGWQAPAEVAQAIGGYLASARLLGRRTAEMHCALARGTDNPDFRPEPMTDAYRREVGGRVAREVSETVRMIRARAEHIPEESRGVAQTVVARERNFAALGRAFGERRFPALRTRHHGDYHLGQVLWTGSDFVIIDFEGEPARPLAERRRKGSPLRDVAGMLRSFDYAAQVAKTDPRWARTWSAWVCAAFTDAYLEGAGKADFVPRDRAQFDAMLATFLVEKAAYEVRYELNHRPDWVGVPLRGMLELLEA